MLKKKTMLGLCRFCRKKWRQEQQQTMKITFWKRTEKKMIGNEGERLTPESKDKMQDTWKAWS